MTDVQCFLSAHRTILITLAVSVAATLLMLTEASAQPFSEIVVFGDSDSDVGNTASRFQFPASPPYFMGRYSNGPVWVERLAELLEVANPLPSERGGTNYAWGGATTGSIVGDSLPDMDEQVRNFLSDNTPRRDQLFVLFGGANDFSFGQPDAGAPARFMGRQISDLASAGGQHFLVGNMPHPLSPDQEDFGRADEFNPLLGDELEKVRTEFGVRIYEVDVAEVIDRIAAAPATFGFSNIHDAACRDCEDPNAVQIVPDPDEYVLWDGVHFSTHTYSLIGDAAYAALPKTAKQPSVSLISKQSHWRYFPGTSEPSPFPELDWANAGFDDTDWEIGRDGLGFGDANDLHFVDTILEDMHRNYGSLYARHEFTVDDPGKLSALKLHIDYDDAFIAYINGAEVARSEFGTAGEAVAHDATLRIPSRDSSYRDVVLVDLAEFPDLLTMGGPNVLAIQGINRRAADGDFVLAQLRLSGVVVSEPTGLPLGLLGCLGLFGLGRRKLVIVGKSFRTTKT